MEDRAEATVGERVELEYQLVREDWRQALKARARASSRAVRMQRLLLLAAVLLGGVSVVPLLHGEGPDLVPLVTTVLVVVLVFVLQPRLMARQFHKMASRHGTYRAVVDDTGATVINTGGSTHLYWTAAPHYAETPDLFVLLSDDRNVSCLTLLPKRGAQEPGGADALRALLDRHIRRL
ncbi:MULTISPECIES: YcxB family protein [unclassified Streptomyces]|uniref:YcxB family protein n=1 Tax=unclassified Streptomyces TaxID=2593676 RepID=UPI000DB9BA73|nr:MULTISPECIES: YcxB family protein [unclassified Streptomyces]MYT73131.1 YcxB family protein [Streptomyces sp. SID8367]RAJ73591.1 hypothetical protein K377_07020 [Streptomyces sp. PsTaAH-137]